MKKFMRITLAVAVLAYLTPIALAHAPGGGVPQPQMDALTTATTVTTPWWSALIALFLSWLSR